MSVMNSTIPVGMESIEQFLLEIRKKADVYKYCNLKPPHFLIRLDAGNGQTTLAEYITDFFVDEKIRNFGSLDTYLEYSLDGSMKQLKEIQFDIANHAGYMNEFNGNIVFDISGLSTKHNELQIPYFINMVSKLSASATLIFYVPTVTNRTLDSLTKKLSNAVENIMTMTIPAYTSKQLVEIAKRTIEDMGVEIKEHKTLEVIQEYIEENQITTAKEAAVLGENLTQYAIFYNSHPVLSLKEVNKVQMSKKALIIGGN